MADKIAVGTVTSENMMMMARVVVANYFNEHVDVTDKKKISIDDVYVVWFSKTLKNWKALVSTTVPDGMYYEITHNGNTGETYVDVYKKWDNVTVKDFSGTLRNYMSALAL